MSIVFTSRPHSRGRAATVGRQEPRRIQDERHFRRNVNERRQQRIEKPERGEPYADGIDGDGPHEILPDDAARPACDSKGIGELREIIA